jgi:hypothetical protein
MTIITNTIPFLCTKMIDQIITTLAINIIPNMYNPILFLIHRPTLILVLSLIRILTPTQSLNMSHISDICRSVARKNLLSRSESNAIVNLCTKGIECDIILGHLYGKSPETSNVIWIDRILTWLRNLLSFVAQPICIIPEVNKITS